MVDDWTDVSLGELVEIKHGFAFKGEYFCEDCRPDALITPGNFALGGGFQENKAKYYDGPVHLDYVLSSGELVVTMTDLSKTSETLGYAAIVPTDLSYRLLHNQRIGLVRLKVRGRALTSFLHLTDAKCLVPPTDVMRRLGRLLGPLIDRQYANYMEARTLTTLRDTLLPKLISGELRIPEAGIAETP